MTKQHKDLEREPVIIYTDGACSGNPGPGGWSAILSQKGKRKEIYGGERNTTNNRMELTACIEALNSLLESVPVILFTDSKYVQKGITTWIPDWKAKGWVGANKKPIKNKDLWLRLDDLNDQFDIKWRWVKSHSGNVGNERADFLAATGMQPYL